MSSYFFLKINDKIFFLTQKHLYICKTINSKTNIMSKLSPITIAVIKDLQKDINDLLLLNSNVEVIWKLENLDTMQQAFKMSANLIRKSLKQNI